MGYEYKCIPAPARPKRRSRKARSPSERIALAMEQMIQEHAVDGWEYMRADLVQVLEKPGLLSRPQEIHRTVLIFRRPDEETREARAREARYEQEGIVEGPAPRDGGLRRGARGHAALSARDDENEARTRVAEESLRLGEEDRVDPARRPGPPRRTPPSGLG